LKPVAGLALQSERFDNGESFGKIIFSKARLSSARLSGMIGKN
jgi:hypothetical protein